MKAPTTLDDPAQRVATDVCAADDHDDISPPVTLAEPFQPRERNTGNQTAAANGDKQSVDIVDLLRDLDTTARLAM